MGYELRPDEKAADAINRVGREQIDQALVLLEDFGRAPDSTVHEVRKCFKRIRGLIRLVRKEVGKDCYRFENTFFRNLGRGLSDLRDSAVAIETVKGLRKTFAEQLSEDAFEHVAAKLSAQHDAAVTALKRDTTVLEHTMAQLEEAGDRMADWPVTRAGFCAFAPSIRKVYSRGATAMKKAYKSPSAESFHEWRKRSKYLWYHVTLLRFVWPPVMEALKDETHLLSNYLGEDHDLAMLTARLNADPAMARNANELEMLLELAQARSEELRALAHPVGLRLYAEPPGAYTGRIKTYWNAALETASALHH